MHALTAEERRQALDVCAIDPVSNVFVAARLQDGSARPDSVLCERRGGRVSAVCWASANIVPVEADADALRTFARPLVHRRAAAASIFGPQDQVRSLWRDLAPAWGPPRTVRESQPLMVARSLPAGAQASDPRVRPARADEVDLVLPAAAHMFTSEIGYPPYVGSPRYYRDAIRSLIHLGHTFVVVEDGRVVFKTDIGSAALGVAQLQGVWVAPDLRGQGMAAPALAAVMEQVFRSIAPTICLYVNDFNAPARALYDRLGFEQVGTYQTVIL